MTFDELISIKKKKNQSICYDTYCIQIVDLKRNMNTYYSLVDRNICIAQKYYFFNTNNSHCSMTVRKLFDARVHELTENLKIIR